MRGMDGCKHNNTNIRYVGTFASYEPCKLLCMTNGMVLGFEDKYALEDAHAIGIHDVAGVDARPCVLSNSHWVPLVCSPHR